MKVACEQVVLGGAASAMVVRPGLIVGPGDPTGRFTYWPARLGDAAERPEVLAPGSPDDTVQVIDVRDLAAWIVDSAERRQTGRLRRHRRHDDDRRPAGAGGGRLRRDAETGRGCRRSS